MKNTVTMTISTGTGQRMPGDRLRKEQPENTEKGMGVKMFGKKKERLQAVSYTHLTLPTTCDV